MITLHADTTAAIGQPTYYPLLLVEMDFASGVVYAHTGVGDFVWNGHIFKGVGLLGKIADWQEGEQLQAYGITLELSGVDQASISISLTEHYQGRALKIWVAFLDENSILAGDPVGPWRWRMDTMSGEFGKTATVTLNAESRMVEWEKPRTRRYTDADQRAEYPDDFGCEFVSAAAEKEIEF